MWSLGSHLGSTVSALVDGQLDAQSEERAWAHVLRCVECHRLVERETWVKRRLSAMGGSEPPARLLGSLYELREEPPSHEQSARDAVEAWAAVGALEHRARTRRRAGLVLAGAGSLSAAVFGFASLGAPVLGIGGAAPAGPPTASLTTRTSPAARDTAVPTTAVVAPEASVHGRLPRHRPRR